MVMKGGRERAERMRENRERGREKLKRGDRRGFI